MNEQSLAVLCTLYDQIPKRKRHFAAETQHLKQQYKAGCYHTICPTWSSAYILLAQTSVLNNLYF